MQSMPDLSLVFSSVPAAYPSHVRVISKSYPSHACALQVAIPGRESHSPMLPLAPLPLCRRPPFSFTSLCPIPLHTPMPPLSLRYLSRFAFAPQASPDGCAFLPWPPPPAGARRTGVAALRPAGAPPPRRRSGPGRLARPRTLPPPGEEHPSRCPSHAGIDGAGCGVELRLWRVELLLPMRVCGGARRIRVAVRVRGTFAACFRAMPRGCFRVVAS